MQCSLFKSGPLVCGSIIGVVELAATPQHQRSNEGPHVHAEAGPHGSHLHPDRGPRVLEMLRVRLSGTKEDKNVAKIFTNLSSCLSCMKLLV